MSDLGTRVRDAVRDWPPSSFAFVMASGITSSALQQAGAGGWSVPPLLVGITGFVVLLAVALARLVSTPVEVVHSLADPARAFGYFTVVAAAGVLAVRLAGDDAGVPAAAFAVLALGLGVLLLYLVPAALILRPGPRDNDPGPDGGWLLWVVALQSLSLVFSNVDLGIPDAAALISFSLWTSGVLLYLALTALILGRLFTAPVNSTALLPSYWILTGATAISALAGLRLLHVRPAPGFLLDLHATLTGTGYALWSFGTWWIPLLLVLGVWRHTVGHQPLRYEVGWWSILFPLGMYSTTSSALGESLHSADIQSIGRIGAGVTALLWAVAVIAMLAQELRRRPARSSRSTHAPRSAR